MSAGIKYIESHDALVDCCAELSGSEWLAIDTEFMREKTYYPRLCLIQVACAETIYCIDALTIQDWEPMRAVLVNTGITKVFHAARQDLEVLYYLCGTVPAPVFDTQIAAGLLGQDDQLGYAALVETITGKVLPKAHQRTDWSIRPLPDNQLHYAADDVRYLQTVYTHLLEQLEQKSRLSWAQEDNGYLTDVGLYETKPEQAYQRIKQGRTLSPVQQQILRELASWRERLAQESNRPRSWVARDGLLIYLSQSQPQTRERLEQVHGFSNDVRERQGENILAAIHGGLQHQGPVYEQFGPFSKAEQNYRDRMLKRIKQRAQELDIRPQILGARREVDAIIRGNNDCALLRGWRRQEVGEELLQLGSR